MVVEIDGLSTLLTTNALQTRVRYGDPNIKYGDPGLIYGGLRPLTDSSGNALFKSLLSKEGSSLTLDQRLEPEQGRASVTTLSLTFIDKDKFMSQVISPGVLLPEILGRRVTVRVGYRQISYPDDYFVIFRGVISQATPFPGKVVMQFSDANIQRRQELFFTPTTQLASDISDSATTIPVVANEDFFQQIAGPDGTFDSGVKTYIQIGDEWMEYDETGFGTNEFTVTRGARGTTAEAHSADDDVSAGIQIEDNALTLALKLMLSGWNGPYKTDVEIKNLADSGVPAIGTQPEYIVLPDGIDAKEVYGLTTGDYITVKNATNASNNKTVRIIDFLAVNDRPNRIIVTDGTFIQETGTPATMDLRSQFDTLPTTAGLKLEPVDVDVDEHTTVRNTFLSDAENALRFFITSEEASGKDFLERECYLPVSCYSLTRFGRLSVGITKPPIADERLSFLNKDNILNPNDLAPFRGLNNRAFFNEVQFFWDATDEGEFTNAIKFLDSESLSLIGISRVLPIRSKGARTDLGSNTLFEKRASFLLSRYKRGAEQIQSVQVSYGVGNLIEAGDVIALDDQGDLQITNLNTGERDIGIRLFEVVRRSIDYKYGKVKLDLIAGIGSEATDRFATISPSSELDNGSTASLLKIKDSFGALFPNNESRKWRDYIGNKIVVRPFDWSSYQEVTLTGIDPTDRFKLQISPPLTGAPPSGFIVDIPPYPTGADPIENVIYKSIHAFLDPTVIAVTGTTGQIEVPTGDIGKFFVGSVIRVHDWEFTLDSGDVRVTAVDPTGSVIDVGESLGFVPTGGEYIDLIGFPDQGGAYRFI